MRLFTDASLDRAGVVGIAYVLDDEIRGLHVEGQKHIFGNYTSMEAEYEAMMNGIHAASWQCGDTLLVNVDCQPLVEKMMSSRMEEDYKWCNMRDNCHRILNTFDHWEINSVPRSQNEQADELASQSLRVGREAL